MEKVVIIVAGGKGSRFGSEVPKQFLPFPEKPMLFKTFGQFYEYDKNIRFLLAIPGSWQTYWNNLCARYNFQIEHQVITGGTTRYGSVKNCLKHVEENTVVAIHDGVRPLVSTETIRNTFDTATDKGSAIPVIDIHDSLRLVKGNENKNVDRNNYKIVQTPQTFHAKILKAAFQLGFKPSFTDDASVIEHYGYKIWLVNGNRENIKITTTIDMITAHCLLQSNAGSKSV